MDETAAEPGALGGGRRRRGVPEDLALRRDHRRCSPRRALVRAAGAEVYLASTLDGPLGIAAGVHAAAALASRGPLPHCGLATLELFDGPRRPAAARATGAIARARRAPGSASSRRLVAQLCSAVGDAASPGSPAAARARRAHDDEPARRGSAAAMRSAERAELARRARPTTT